MAFKVLNDRYGMGATDCNRNTLMVVGLWEKLEQLGDKSTLRSLFTQKSLLNICVFLLTGVGILKAGMVVLVCHISLDTNYCKSQRSMNKGISE